MYDLLLEWCSERERGSLDSLRETHDWLAQRYPDPKRPNWEIAAYNLQSLGHLELSWPDRWWSITPSVATVVTNSGGNAMLVGARPRWLKERLDGLEWDEDPVVRDLAPRVVLNSPIGQPYAPSALYLTSPSDELMAKLCARLGIEYEGRVSERIAASLPSIDSYLGSGHRLSPPPGFQPHRLTVTDGRRRWEEVDDDSPAGAYEYRGYGPPRHLFNDGERLWEADRNVVVYAELRRQGHQVIFYDDTREQLFVAARFPMPLLYARCGVFRTGLLPTHLRAVPGVPERLCPVNRFSNIPPELFCRLADRLGQAAVTLSKDCR